MEKRKGNEISSSEDEGPSRKRFFKESSPMRESNIAWSPVRHELDEDFFVNPKSSTPILKRNGVGMSDNEADKVTVTCVEKEENVTKRQPVGSNKASFKAQNKWTRKYIGDLLVSAYTTTSLLSLKDNESMSIEYYKPKPKTSSKSQIVKEKDSIIVRFRNSQGREVGRINKSDAKFVSQLILHKIVEVEGTVVNVPEKIRAGSDVILSLRVYILPDAFITPSFDETGEYRKIVDVGSDKPSIESPEEKMLRERKNAINKLFDRVDLHPVDSASISKRNIFGEKPSSKSTKKKGKEKEKMVVVVDSDEEGVMAEDQVENVFHKAATTNFSLPLLEPPTTFALTLRPYQQQALSWMVQREIDNQTLQGSIHPLWETYTFPIMPEQKGWAQLNDQERFYLNPYSGELSLEFPKASKKCLGGILADEMGLGKTIQIASLIHYNRYQSEDESDDQGDEFSDLESEGCYIPSPVKGHQKDKGTIPRRHKRGHQTLVVAPMSLLAQWESELKRCDASRKLTTQVYYGGQRGLINHSADVVITSYGTLVSDCDKKNGLLDHSWYRVVLDEAHNIKSRTTKTAKISYKLKAKRRWLVTATPIVNRLEDLFSLLRFLRVEPWGNFSFFRTFITIPFSKGDTIALDIVQVILESVLLRREKTMKLEDGRPLIPLPKKVVITERLPLSKKEREIYDAIYYNSKSIFDKYAAEGSVLRHFTAIFAVLLRLRLCVLHPALALKKGVTELGGGEEDIEKLIEKYAGENVDGNKFKGNVLKQLLEATNNEDEKECCICFNVMEETMFIKKCMHKCCRDCILDYIERLEANGEKARCPICSEGPITSDDILEVVRSTLHREKPKKLSSDLGSDDEQDHAKPQLVLRNTNFKSSTKLDRLIWHLKSIFITDSTSKVVVFSQFTSFLDLVQLAIKREGFTYTRLDGSMNQKKRVAALEQFNGSNCSIFLASMKAGGVGLNLVAANTVILLDTWWNESTISQAVDRVHRLGQTRDVNVIVILIEKSVEDRMLAIQKRKTAIVNGALQKGGQEKKQEMLRNLEEIFKD